MSSNEIVQVPLFRWYSVSTGLKTEIQQLKCSLSAFQHLWTLAFC